VKIAERWFVWAGMVLLGGIALAGLVVAVYAAWLFHDLPDASELADYRPPTATRVYAGDGTLIGEFSDERRIYVSYDQIPLTVVQAFLAAEDRNFFQHGGIDVGGIGRASIKNIFNLVQGRRLEGGSTITQQVAKNVLLTNESSLNRKLKEAILANRLEATLSKEQILNLYLNEIFLGYRSFGIASAAYNYFGKSLAQLTPDEAAFLASLPKGPNNYHPKRHPGAAKGRRDWVLGEMEQSGWLTEAQLVEARARPLVTRDAPQRSEYKDADFFVEEARRQAAANPDWAFWERDHFWMSLDLTGLGAEEAGNVPHYHAYPMKMDEAVFTQQIHWSIEGTATEIMYGNDPDFFQGSTTDGGPSATGYWFECKATWDLLFTFAPELQGNVGDGYQFKMRFIIPDPDGDDAYGQMFWGLDYTTIGQGPAYWPIWKLQSKLTQTAVEESSWGSIKQLYQ